MKATGITATVILFLFMGIAVPTFAQDQRDEHPKEEHPQPAPHPQQAQPQPHAQPERPQPQPHAQPERPQPQPHAQPQAPARPQRTEQPHPQPNAQPEHAQAQHHQHTQPQQPQQNAQPTPQAQQAEHQAHPPQQATHHNAGQPRSSEHNNPQHAAYPTTSTAHRTPPSPAQQRGNAAVWQQHRAQNWQSEHRSWEQRGGYRGYRIPDDRYRTYFGDRHRFRIYGLPFEDAGGYPRFQYQGYWLQLLDPWPYNWASNWFDTDPVYITWMDGGYYLIDPRYPDYPLAVEIIQ